MSKVEVTIDAITDLKCCKCGRIARFSAKGGFYGDQLLCSRHAGIRAMDEIKIERETTPKKEPEESFQVWARRNNVTPNEVGKALYQHKLKKGGI